MIDPDDDPIGEILARSRERAERFGRSLDQLRSGDPAFAEASGSYPSDMSEWQSAVYLLTAAIKCASRGPGGARRPIDRADDRRA